MRRKFRPFARRKTPFIGSWGAAAIVALLFLLSPPAATSAITEYPVPTAGGFPDGITTGPDGALWFVENQRSKVGRLTTSGSFSEFAIPIVESYPWEITTGPDGALWFTEFRGGAVGRITTAGAVNEFRPPPFPTEYSGPHGITVGPDGALWFTEEVRSGIGRITTAGQMTEFPIPTSLSGPWGITLGPDGALWFTEFSADKIGRITTAEGNVYPAPVHRSFTVDATPPQTAIDSGPQGTTNDPTPTFAFSSEPGASFECKLDSGPYAACGSPKTTSHLADGSHTFSVRATDPADNTDPSPASRNLTLRTASVEVSGSALVVTAAPGAEDNLAITRPSASIVRVTDFPGGAYRGSGVHTGAGCTRSGDYTANCLAAAITPVLPALVTSAGQQADRVVNSTDLPSSLYGGWAP